uniref:Uncharacterized protein n=1 Tax=Physcomitrium patens TaxID=3218 RepID=A0A2K1ICG0_PHYPA|nr:hypothetical protein PHYPA_030445 [Physcomitrium patens]
MDIRGPSICLPVVPFSTTGTISHTVGNLSKGSKYHLIYIGFFLHRTAPHYRTLSVCNSPQKSI